MYLPLRAISVFHAAASSGSISRAAAELNVTPSAVSQQIQSLETHLGTALMTKVGRGVGLTEAGERYFAMISEEIDRIAEATQRMRGLRSVTLLTVRATPTLSTKWLLPRLRSFLDGHPDLEVRLNGTNEVTDFAQDAVDIEIRHGSGQWPGVYVEALAEETFLPVCSPAYCAAASLDAADLPRHRLIHSVKSQVQWPYWFSAAQTPPFDPGQRVLFDRSHMAIDAAVDGMGIALESTLMMWRELRDGTLTCPVRQPPDIRLKTQWIVCPYEHLHKKKVTLFLDWLRAERAAWEAASGASAVHGS
ncbi:LysR substrate-binding domain-containing protein [Caballeronia ptereochthonis]|uniref:LysR family transcriptional regulator n=1 Tax=Caballeronia ptereochthonis TaxID=1777144 RepID=A0A158AI65_9BURK|nr:LysR substrate-binding domain-containing protein [Caballeronia ptereochthonis]SAK57415.1 LysR family transcriptional regulator [Caballeronia ptereochthonis]